jgi:G3E family GTPase
MKENFRLDGIVTLVDAKHISLHLDDAPEAKEQIAFADTILLNKTDLVPTAELDRLEERIRKINSVATVYRTERSNLGVDKVIDIHAFDLDHKLSLDGDFLERDLPFEWSGVYHLDAGEHTLVLEPGPDPVMGAVLLPLVTHDHGHTECDHEHGHSEDHHHKVHGEHEHEHQHGRDGHGHDASSPLHGVLHESEEVAEKVFTFPASSVRPGGELRPGQKLYRLVLGADISRYKINVPEHGHYALFTEHGLGEFSGRIEHAGHAVEPEHVHEHGGHAHEHSHDESVKSIGIEEKRELDAKKLNAWLSELLQTKGQDIFRMKGILNIKGQANRFVFQGVHMLFEGKPDRPWKADEVRKSQLVFIGRNLDREALLAGFRRCLV